MVPSIHGVAPKASFLGLPQELRDQIYHLYFKVEGGYMHDGEADKLVRADGSSIEISLRYVCRSIAWETRNCALSLNSITFSPVCRDDWRSQALSLTHILGFQSTLRLEMLCRLGNLLTSEMFESPSPEYAQYMPIIEAHVAEQLAREESRPRPRHHPRHVQFYWSQEFKEGLRDVFPIGGFRMDGRDNTVACNRTVLHLLRLLAEKHPVPFSGAIEEILPGWNDSHSLGDFLEIGFDSWAVPSLTETVDNWKNFQIERPLESFGQSYAHGGHDLDYHGPQYRYTQKFFFSATAMAIKFLKQTTQYQRRLIQTIVLNEDKAAIGNPQSHVLGLIPFCKENPKLQIEHRVNVWANMLVGGENLSNSCMAFTIESPWDPEDDGYPQAHQTSTGSAVRSFAFWIMQTLEVVKDGMPPQSYTMIFDGGPDLNHATETFTKLFKPIVTWLTLKTDCVQRGIFAPPESQQYPFTTTNSAEGFTAAHNRTSTIQCNFTLDQPWDYQTITKDLMIQETEKLDWTGVLWQIDEDLPDCWDVSTSKLDWVDIRLEYYDLERLRHGS
ncbi:hypothetical protein FGRMN_11099 [Fusarium graminum]|nr:hypothetical protein FGRMN_11099 [Fusarium graminum]